MRACPLCQRHLAPDNFSTYPLWPRALGGDFAPKFLQGADWCLSCQTTIEQEIDSRFLKMRQLHSDFRRSACALLDATKAQAAPLCYLGMDPHFPLEPGWVCDVWSGLANETIFVLRPISEARRAGDRALPPDAPCEEIVLFVQQNATAFWSEVALRSIANYFPRARRFYLNLAHETVDTGDWAQAMNDWPDEQQYDYFGQMKFTRHLHHDLSDGAAWNRFLLKFGFGIGLNMAGNAFLRTRAARQLRKRFWESEPTLLPLQAGARQKIQQDHAQGALSYPDLWSLAIGRFLDHWAVIVTAPNGQFFECSLGEFDPDNPAFGRLDDQCWLFAPQRHKVLGPLTSQEILAHRQQMHAHPVLSQIERWRAQTPIRQKRSMLQS